MCDVNSQFKLCTCSEKIDKKKPYWVLKSNREDGEEHLSFTQGAGHGGSHPHLVHEFLTALAEDRDPFPNAVQSANWTCTGIIAHESALAGGELKKLPEFTLS